jgi:chorismate mutase
MWCRGIRGATTVDNNNVEDILNASKELLQMMIDANGVEPEDVACAIFTTTSDLNAAFPARLCTHFDTLEYREER